ncbi:hypothetical protein JCM10212_006624 [Sporobolomyces blumeae]
MHARKPTLSRLDVSASAPGSPLSNLRSRTPSNTSNPSSSAPSPTSSPRLASTPIVRSASTASAAAGDSAFAALLPPKPDPSTSIRSVESAPHLRDSDGPDRSSRAPERSSSRFADHRLFEKGHAQRRGVGFPHFVPRRRRRLGWLAAVLSLVLVAAIVRRISASTIVLVRFKLSDYAYSEGWGWPFADKHCGIRKEPIVFVKGEGAVSIVWEVGKCPLGENEWRLRWRQDGQDAGARTAPLARTEMELDYDGQPLRTVYSARLDGLASGELYTYDVLLASNPIRSHSFPFLGASSTRSPHLEQPQTLHLAVLADNQFNLRTFHKILSRLASVSRSFSSAYTPDRFPRRRPDLVVHAGDFVQNPHDLSQWQTDFWDPMTKALRLAGGGRGTGQASSLGSQVPVLVARGNHDWDKFGKNVYVGGTPSRERWNGHVSNGTSASAGGPGRGQSSELVARSNRATYFSTSPHPRVRIVVLDSNLVTDRDRLAQEEWLEWELGRAEWNRATLRIAVVHTPPWIEWWNRRAWTEGSESEWSTFVRHRLTPILVRARCSLVISGHSHAYSRAFLPYTLVDSYTSPSTSRDSRSVPPFARSTALERGWEKRTDARRTGIVDEPGLVSVVVGGAGGTLDFDRVEEWGLFQEGKWGEGGLGRTDGGNYHFGLVNLHLAGTDGTRAPRPEFLDHKRDWKTRTKGEWVYRARPVSDDGDDETRCAKRGGTVVEDLLEWKAVDVDGKVRDRFGIVGSGCTA